MIGFHYTTPLGSIPGTPYPVHHAVMLLLARFGLTGLARSFGAMRGDHEYPAVGAALVTPSLLSNLEENSLPIALIPCAVDAIGVFSVCYRHGGVLAREEE